MESLLHEIGLVYIIKISTLGLVNNKTFVLLGVLKCKPI